MDRLDVDPAQQLADVESLPEPRAVTRDASTGHHCFAHLVRQGQRIERGRREPDELVTEILQLATPALELALAGWFGRLVHRVAHPSSAGMLARAVAPGGAARMADPPQQARRWPTTVH